MNDLHSTSAKNEAGTNKHGIADFCGCSNTVFKLCYSLTLRTRNVELVEQVFKCVSVFSSVDCLAVSTDDLNSAIVERLCQIDCCLTAESSDNALGLFKLDDVHYVFGSERLEVQLICGCIVC